MSEKNYEFPAATDHGSVLPPDQVAVTFDEENGYQILLPQSDQDDRLPEGAAALIAVTMRLTEDPEFYDDMLQWFADRHQG